MYLCMWTWLYMYLYLSSHRQCSGNKINILFSNRSYLEHFALHWPLNKHFAIRLLWLTRSDFTYLTWFCASCIFVSTHALQLLFFTVHLSCTQISQRLDYQNLLLLLYIYKWKDWKCKWKPNVFYLPLYYVKHKNQRWKRALHKVNVQHYNAFL